MPMSARFLIAGFYLDGSTPPPLYDISCNLQAHPFERDRAAVLTRAKEAGVNVVSLTGYSLETSKVSCFLHVHRLKINLRLCSNMSSKFRICK